MDLKFLFVMGTLLIEIVRETTATNSRNRHQRRETLPIENVRETTATNSRNRHHRRKTLPIEAVRETQLLSSLLQFRWAKALFFDVDYLLSIAVVSLTFSIGKVSLLLMSRVLTITITTRIYNILS